MFEPPPALSLALQLEQPPLEPLPLPPNWIECDVGDGEVYYYNESTGESVWERPAATPRFSSVPGL